MTEWKRVLFALYFWFNIQRTSESASTVFGKLQGGQINSSSYMYMCNSFHSNSYLKIFPTGFPGESVYMQCRSLLFCICLQAIPLFLKVTRVPWLTMESWKGDTHFLKFFWEMVILLNSSKGPWGKYNNGGHFVQRKNFQIYF